MSREVRNPMRVLSEGDLPFQGYDASAVAIDEARSVVYVSGVSSRNDGSHMVPAFVLRLPYDDARWQDGGETVYPITASFNLGIHLKIDDISLNERELCLAQGDFKYRITLPQSGSVDVYTFSVPESFYADFYDDVADDSSVLKRLVAIAAKNIAPVTYVIRPV